MMMQIMNDCYYIHTHVICDFVRFVAGGNIVMMRLSLSLQFAIRNMQLIDGNEKIERKIE